MNREQDQLSDLFLFRFIFLFHVCTFYSDKRRHLHSIDLTQIFSVQYQRVTIAISSERIFR